MTDHEEWLRRELNGVGAARGLGESLTVVVDVNELMAGGRYDMGVAHILMAGGHAISKGLSVNGPPLTAKRTMTDEQLRRLACSLTWADWEVFLSQFGAVLWKSLWRTT